MTRRSNAIRLAVGGLAVLVLAACHRQGSGRGPLATPSTSSPAISASSSVAGPAVSPAGERAALDAVGVAQAFAAAVCPYSWRDPIPYGQRVNAALARWGAPAFAAAHRWSPARIATAAAGLVERQAEQACGQITGGLDPESGSAAGVLLVRLSVTVTAQAQGSAASTAQEIFDLQLGRQDNGGWLISSGRW
jgi:hypothetical protein